MAAAGVRGRRVYTGRNVTAHFDMDRKGIAELAMNPVLMGSVMACAENEAKPYAIRISPRTNKKHKHYADSFSVVPGAVMIRRMRRVAAHLINDAPHATYVEWGNDQFEGHRILGKTLDHLNQLGPN